MTAPGSPRQMRCWPRPGSPQSPRPPAAPGRSGSAMPRTGECGTPSTGGPSWPAAKTPGPRSSTRTHGAAAKASTGPCAGSAPAGLAFCGAAGPTTATTTPPVIPGRSCSPPDPTGSAPLPNGGIRSRGQGWPQATHQGSALTSARTPPHCGMPEPLSPNHSQVDSGSLSNSPDPQLPFRFASRKYWDELSRDLKPIYTAVHAQAAAASQLA
jgi:hypothetical protein